MDEKQFLETWQIHDRINLYLLDAIDPGALVSLSASKGRTVGEQFAHIHNVRLMWLKSAAPALLSGLVKIEKEHVFDGPNGKSSLKGLFDERRQLIVYHFMFDPTWETHRCPGCTGWVDALG